MTISIPTYKQIINRIRSDVNTLLPDVDPTIENSFIRSFTDSLAGRSFDIVKLYEQLIKELFPQTASSFYLERWANYEGIMRNPATISNGFVVFTGNTFVPAGTELSSSEGYIYKTDEDLTLSSSIFNIDSLVRDGVIVTATTPSNHNLATGVSVEITDSTASEYNGIYRITVINEKEFTFNIETTPPTTVYSVTGTFVGGYVLVSSNETGKDKNIPAGGILSILTPIAGVGSRAYVQYSTISGGTDAETDEDLLSRVLQSRSNPVANFNVAAIEKIARSVAGVTRVFVKEVTPEIGDVTIYFLKDNEENIIPTSQDVIDVKAVILTIKPANTSDDSVYVLAPTPVSTDYTFTAIDPDTSTMQESIIENLKAFYVDEVEFEETITEDKYRSAIINTIDNTTGSKLLSFTLSTPSGDIVISDGEMGVLGTITFSL
jgi:uncharacterized phage protein gp47/JayE